MFKLKRKKHLEKWSFEKGGCEKCHEMYERILILAIPAVEDFFKNVLQCENCDYREEALNRFISVLRDTLFKKILETAPSSREGTALP